MTATVTAATTVADALTDSQRRLFSGLVRERYSKLISDAKVERDHIARAIDRKLRTKGGITETDLLADEIDRIVNDAPTPNKTTIKKMAVLARKLERHEQKEPELHTFSMQNEIPEWRVWHKEYDAIQRNIQTYEEDTLHRVNAEGECQPLSVSISGGALYAWHGDYFIARRAINNLTTRMVTLDERVNELHDESRRIREEIALMNLSSAEARAFLDTIPTSA